MSTLNTDFVNLPDTPRATMRDADELPDGQLLRQFSAGRDADAFEQLVRRHGPMVLGVCRRMFAMRMLPTMPFRPPFWSSYARRPPSEDRNCWATGSMAWPFALPPGRESRLPSGSIMKCGPKSWWNVQPQTTLSGVSFRPCWMKS